MSKYKKYNLSNIQKSYISRMFGDGIITRYPNQKLGATHKWTYTLRYFDPSKLPQGSIYDTYNGYSTRRVTTISMKSFICQGFVKFIPDLASLPVTHKEMSLKIGSGRWGMYILNEEGLRDRGISPEVLRASIALGVKL